MLDASHWKLRGPVASLRIELADWDADRQQWTERRFFNYVRFDGHGRVLQLDQNGPEQSTVRTAVTYDEGGRPVRDETSTVGGEISSTTTWQYDDGGRPASMSAARADGTELRHEQWTYDPDGRSTRTINFAHQQPVDAYFIEGSEFAYPAGGAVQQVTRYDEHGLAVEVEFLDAAHAVVQRVVMERDAEGRVVAEEARMAGAVAIPREPGMSDDDFLKMQALVESAWGSTRTTYEYDAAGRPAARVQQSGLLGDERTTYEYDDHGNVLQESERQAVREMNLDENGTPRMTRDTVRFHQVRAAYVYDGHGNWTERVFGWRNSEDGAFQPSNGEWRTIEYRAAGQA